MGFVEKTASNGSVNALSTYKMKSIFLLTGVGGWDKGSCFQDFEI